MKTTLLTLAVVALGFAAPFSLQAQCSGCEGKKKDSKKEACAKCEQPSMASTLSGCSGCSGEKKDSKKEASASLAQCEGGCTGKKDSKKEASASLVGSGCDGCSGEKKDSKKEASTHACGSHSKDGKGGEARA